MKRLNKLSDEELAAYMEGILSPEILGQSRDDMDVDTFEVLNVAVRARGLKSSLSDECSPMPFSAYYSPASVYEDREQSMPLAGFTGDGLPDDDDELEDDD